MASCRSTLFMPASLTCFSASTRPSAAHEVPASRHWLHTSVDMLGLLDMLDMPVLLQCQHADVWCKQVWTCLTCLTCFSASTWA
eukprot:1142985-Pelagomonas_calceolata.AAC.2